MVVIWCLPEGWKLPLTLEDALATWETVFGVLPWAGGDGDFDHAIQQRAVPLWQHVSHVVAWDHKLRGRWGPSK